MLPLLLQLSGQELHLLVVIQPQHQVLCFFMGFLDAVFQHLPLLFEGDAFDLEPSDSSFQDVYDFSPFLGDADRVVKLILVNFK